jgi:hypothetical protein
VRKNKLKVCDLFRVIVGILGGIVSGMYATKPFYHSIRSHLFKLAPKEVPKNIAFKKLFCEWRSKGCAIIVHTDNTTHTW